LISNDIRMAGYDPYGTKTAAITNMGDGSDGTQKLIFTLVADDDTIDNNGDSVVDEVGELNTIEYKLVSGNPR